jgi:nuclear pore complex protein Nup155
MYTLRTECYEQVWRIIAAVDAISVPANNETVATSLKQRKEEAYGVIDLSEDEVFQNCLFDWYLQNGSSQRLLDLTNPFVIAYLQRRAVNEREQADLLWKYYAHHNEYFEAAKVQLQLAKSGFTIELPTRVEYLSRAKANASTRLPTFGRLNGSKQEVIRDISDQLDCASVQLDVLRRLETDDRLQEPTRTTVLQRLNGQVLSLDNVSRQVFFLSSFVFPHH